MIKKGQVFCIIGAGGSGLVSAKYCLEQGYRVIVLEKESSIGGAWFSKSYQCAVVHDFRLCQQTVLPIMLHS